MGCFPHIITTEVAEWKAAYEAEHDAMFVKGTGDKATVDRKRRDRKKKAQKPGFLQN